MRVAIDAIDNVRLHLTSGVTSYGVSDESSSVVAMYTMMYTEVFASFYLGQIR